MTSRFGHVRFIPESGHLWFWLRSAVTYVPVARRKGKPRNIEKVLRDGLRGGIEQMASCVLNLPRTYGSGTSRA